MLLYTLNYKISSEDILGTLMYVYSSKDENLFTFIGLTKESSK